MNNIAINKLLCAAMVNKKFCQTLLKDPATALDNGYFGYKFMLTQEQGSFIRDIQAISLEDFAEQVCEWISQNFKFGVSAFLRDGGTIQLLLEISDKRMYANKRNLLGGIKNQMKSV